MTAQITAAIRIPPTTNPKRMILNNSTTPSS